MAFKIKNFYTQNSSPLRQHEEGHGYEYQANPTEVKKIYSDNGTLEGTLWSDGSYIKSAYTLQKESDATPKFDNKANEDDAVTMGGYYPYGGDNFSPDGEGTEWFYDNRGQKLEIQDKETVNKDFEKLNDETDKYLNTGIYAPGYDAKAEAMKQRLKDLGMDPDLDVKGVYEEKKDPSKVKWSEAPPLGSQERTQWYIDNNLKLDKTTPPLAGADPEPEPIEEVMTSSVPKARNNRRTRRGERIRERNEKAEVRRFANSAKKGIADGSFAFDDDEFQDPTVA